MATKNGRSGNPVAEEIAARLPGYNFFQAVRMIQAQTLKMLRQSKDAKCDTIGGDAPPNQETIRFRQHASWSFPASEIAAAQLDDDHFAGDIPHYEIFTTFIGLVGAHGVLPQHYTERVLSREAEDDGRVLQEFLDLFHHRIVSLYYKAWLRSRLPFRWEQSQLSGRQSEDLFSQSLYALTGFGSAALQNSNRLSSKLRGRQAFSDDLLIYYSGLLRQKPPNAVSLQRLLAEVFNVDISIQQFQGQWIHLKPSDRTSMRSAAQPLGRNCQLGRTAMAGSKVWEMQSKVRIVIGPVGRMDFGRFLPGSVEFAEFEQLARLWAGPQLDLEVQVVLKADEVPSAGCGISQLGRTAWVRNRQFPHDATDAVFQLNGRVNPESPS